MARGVAIPPFIRAWIRRGYEHNPHMTIEEMARHAGCTASAVSHMARREGWHRAAGAVRTRAGRADAGPGERARAEAAPAVSSPDDVSTGDPSTDSLSIGGPPTGGAPTGVGVAISAGGAERRMLLDALWLIASRHVAELQAGRTAPADSVDEAQNRVRDVQALMTTVRTVEKLMDMEAEAVAAAPAVNGAPEEIPEDIPEDIDAFRARIARRLEALCEMDPGEAGTAGTPADDRAG